MQVAKTGSASALTSCFPRLPKTSPSRSGHLLRAVSSARIAIRALRTRGTDAPAAPCGESCSARGSKARARRRSSGRRSRLLGHPQRDAAILLPPLLGGVVRDRVVLAVALGTQPRGVDPE